jgi:hypothetical protein
MDTSTLVQWEEIDRNRLKEWMPFFLPHPEDILALGGTPIHLRAMISLSFQWILSGRPDPELWREPEFLPYLDTLKDVLGLIQNR